MKKIKIVIYIITMFILLGSNIFNIVYAINETQIDNVELEVNMEYVQNDDNTVTAIMHSNVALADTKPTWTLSTDKLNYTKIFDTNMIYTTPVQDINGNVKNISINITQIDDIGPNITIEYVPNTDNTVTVIMHSNEQLGNTKPTWTLSEDKLTYTKIFDANMTYETTAEDIYGNVTNVQISVTQIDDIGPDIKIEYVPNADNTVTVILHSNVELEYTKPTWTLSADKLAYKKIFNTNMIYTTSVQDINGNIKNISINITQIDDIGPDIKIEYVPNADNTVTVIMHSNEKLGDTKSTWTLSADKLTYTKTFDTNMTYTTTVEDIYGNVTNVQINITQIDVIGPNITMEYIYNADSTITVIMHSNEILEDTKPTWTLSADKLNYTKIFNSDIEYSTSVQDIYGNEAWVKIKIKTKVHSYTNEAGPNLTVKYFYDSNDKVTVQIISDTPLNDTKPTWILSQDKLIYTKVFTENNIYTTGIEDINGRQVNVSIIVNFFKDTFKGIDVSEYQKMINWQAVKNSGVDFAIIRVGYRGWGSSGTLVEDMYFDNNIREATKVGMDIGFYFYSQATTIAEAKQEAQFTLGLLSKYKVPIKYPIAIDTERTPVGNGRADRISKELRTEIVKTFCNEIQNAGYKSMIYANKDWLINNLNITSLSCYDVWLAHYTTSTDYKYPYTIWQYTSSGSVSGIVGKVDMNIGYKRY